MNRTDSEIAESAKAVQEISRYYSKHWPDKIAALRDMIETSELLTEDAKTCLNDLRS